jgi:osmotically-inducible protein OsmY
VTLSGTVQQDAQKSAAAQVARAVGGVKRVTNQLTIKPREKY